MALTRWDPFRELEEMSSRLNHFLGHPAPRTGAETAGVTLADWAPAMDVQETEAEYVVKADLPAVKKDDVHVEIRDGVLTVRGERREAKEEKGKTFHRIERSQGRFERRMLLPDEVDALKVAAEFKEGVLEVHLPKSPAAKPQPIAVKVN